MYESGMSIADVAFAHEVTRQAMWAILQRRGVKFRSHLRNGQENHFFIHGRGYTKRQKRAVLLVAKAVKRGRLIPQPCEVCGFSGFCSDGRRAVHAHHDNYDEPLNVRWLCKTCHDKLHNA